MFTDTLKFRPLRLLSLVLLLELSGLLLCGRLPLLETLSGFLTLLTVLMTDSEPVLASEAGSLSLAWEGLREEAHLLRHRMSWGTQVLLMVVLRVVGPIVALAVLAFTGADRWLCDRVRGLLVREGRPQRGEDRSC